MVSGSMFAADDSSSESIEGFVLLLEVDELDPRDEERVSIERSVILVSIQDDGGKFKASSHPTTYNYHPRMLALLQHNTHTYTQ